MVFNANSLDAERNPAGRAIASKAIWVDRSRVIDYSQQPYTEETDKTAPAELDRLLTAV